jgi:hypothetical protein
MLSFQVNFGVGVYTDRRLANTVWSLLESYGFGSIERIINWFDTEERKEMMAAVILNDDSLRQELGYGDQGISSLNYQAAAKVAILTFANWVWHTYINPTWIKDLWVVVAIVPSFSSTDTLVDVLNKIWNFAGATIANVKNSLTLAWEGVKSAGEFIMDGVLPLIYSSISTAINSLIFSIFTIFDNLINEIEFDIIENKYYLSMNKVINLNSLSDDEGLIVQLNENMLKIRGPLFNPEFETLSLTFSESQINLLLEFILYEFALLGVSIITRMLFETKDPKNIGVGQGF